MQTDQIKSHDANFSAADRVIRLCEDGGKLFCRTCNVIPLHERN